MKSGNGPTGAPLTHSLAFSTLVLSAILGACDRRSCPAPPVGTGQATLLGSHPADGDSGVRPDLNSIVLSFSGPVSPGDIKVDLQPGDPLDQRRVPDPVPVEVTLSQGAGTSVVVVAVGAILDRNRTYALAIEDADPTVAPDVPTTLIEINTGILPPGEPTEAVGGMILDENGLPMSRVKVRDMAEGEIVLTGSDGQFHLNFVPTGAQRIEFNGYPRSDNQRFATLIFPLAVLPGFQAAFTRPINLPRLDTDHAVAVNPVGVTVLTSPLVPGFKMTIQPGAARFADMTTPSSLSITEVSTQNPPMGPPSGRVFERLYTIQPPGVTFNPPAEVEYPTPAGLRVGTIVPLTHYDKGAMRWVAFGRAEVVATAIGDVLRSLPSEGVVKSAWQAPSPQSVYTTLQGFLADGCLDDAERLALARQLQLAKLGRQNLLFRALGIDVLRVAACVNSIPTRWSELGGKAARTINDRINYSEYVTTIGKINSKIRCGEKFVGDLRTDKLYLDTARQLGTEVLHLLNDVNGLTECMQPEDLQQLLMALSEVTGSQAFLDLANASSRSIVVDLDQERSLMDGASKGISDIVEGFMRGLDPTGLIPRIVEFVDHGDRAESRFLQRSGEVQIINGLLQQAIQHDMAALSLMNVPFHPRLGDHLAVPDGITDIGRRTVLGRAAGALVSVMGRSSYVGAGGFFRIPGVPAGISVGGGLAQVLDLHPTAVSPRIGGGSLVVDADADGMPDDWEMHYHLDAAVDDALQDPDDDGLTNLEEYVYYGDPHNGDTDNNGVMDGEDVRRGRDAAEQGGDPEGPALVSIDPLVGAPSLTVTLRGDGFGADPSSLQVMVGTLAVPPLSVVGDNLMTIRLPSAFEPGDIAVLRTTSRGVRASNSIFLDVDTDGDGLGDRLEVKLGTNPNLADSDGDGLSDGDEQLLGTNPLNCDTDGDGLEDGFEIQAGTDPKLVDTDGDGLTDDLEDPDGDGLTNYWEQAFGLDPRVANGKTGVDRDADGLPDMVEIAIGTNPLDPDTDGDGIEDGAEVAAGTDPIANDTDQDGLSDGTELAGLGDPLVAEDHSHLVIHGGVTAVFRGRNTVDTLLVESGAVVVTTRASGHVVQRIELHARSVVVAAGGRIDATGSGFRGGNRVGQGFRGMSFGNRTSGSFTTIDGAGSHGGGGSGSDPAIGLSIGLTYGRFDQPTTPGAGGNGDGGAVGADGGGVVRIVCEDLTVDGEVVADGEAGILYSTFDPFNGSRSYWSGAGAGGSIWLTAGVLRGAGVVQANGGSGMAPGNVRTAHAGGGGRVAVERTAPIQVVTPTLGAGGGAGLTGNGASGTVFEVGPESPLGTLRVTPAASAITTVMPGLSFRTVIAIAMRRLWLSDVSLPDDRLAGQELCDEQGSAIARIVGHRGNEFRVEFFGVVPRIGDRVCTRAACGLVDGDAGSRVQWSGYMAWRGDLIGDLQVDGFWHGDFLDIATSVQRIRGDHSDLEVSRITSGGQTTLNLQDLTLVDSAFVAPDPGTVRCDNIALSGTRAQIGRRVVATYVALTGGSIWYAAPSTADSWSPILIEADTILVDGVSGSIPASRFDASGSGYVGGHQQPLFQQTGQTWPGSFTGGASAGSVGHGGSHGGFGGDAVGPPKVYGRHDQAALPGSGGAMNSYFLGLNSGANGGGVVHLIANHLVLNGEVHANGANGGNLVIQVGPTSCVPVGVSGAGTGGSVWIQARRFEGAGLLSAAGGHTVPIGQDCSRFVCGIAVGHAGGGGRIAVSADMMLFAGSTLASGGRGPAAMSGCTVNNEFWSGGAGTVWFGDAQSVYGRLVIDNNGRRTPFVSTPLTSSPIGNRTGLVDGSGTRIDVSNGVVHDGAQTTFGLIGRHVIVDGDTAHPYRIVAHGATWIRVERSLQVGATVQLQGAYYFDALEVRGGARVDSRGEAIVVPGGAPVVDAQSELR